MCNANSGRDQCTISALSVPIVNWLYRLDFSSRMHGFFKAPARVLKKCIVRKCSHEKRLAHCFCMPNYVQHAASKEKQINKKLHRTMRGVHAQCITLKWSTKITERSCLAVGAGTLERQNRCHRRKAPAGTDSIHLAETKAGISGPLPVARRAQAAVRLSSRCFSALFIIYNALQRVHNFRPFCWHNDRAGAPLSMAKSDTCSNFMRPSIQWARCVQFY